MHSILVINPGSTSTKIGVYEDQTEIYSETVRHSTEEISHYPSVAEQYGFREKHIRDALARSGFDVRILSAVVGIGGLLRPMPGGVYRVTESMLADLRAARYGEHASNLGALIADALGRELGVPAFIADPVVVDEMDEVAKVAGHSLFSRRSIFHALNQKAVGRRYARETGRTYEDLTLIIAHMGGGVSVGLHRKGRVVDVNQALNGEGPFSPERSGTLPAGDLVRLCFSGKYSEREILKMITGQGGMVSLMGTNDMREVEKLAEAGDPMGKIFYRAFIYNVGKYIGSLAAAASGRVDAIILTGGISYGTGVREGVSELVGWIAPVAVYPGEGELEALALAGVRALSGDAEVQEY
ncbi:MAG TPA: butyrate kinase [Magnetospirillaceae bacterium]|nr:butyrate kinase [Magnetospirillaceae bacterium]